MASRADEILKTFDTICADPYKTARDLTASGRKVAGYMCTYVPEELLHAAGYMPVRILGWTDGTQRADGLLQAYACTLARGALNTALSGQLDFLDAMVFTHTCDTIQNLTDIWQRNVPTMRHHAIATPVNTKGEAALTYFKAELERLRAFLEAGTGLVSDDAIRASIAFYQKHRDAMRRLYAVRRNNPSCISGHAFLTVVLASFLMPREDHLGLLDELIPELEAMPANGADAKPLVFVCGTVCQSAAYMEAIEAAGCVVVDDDLCTGSRAFIVDAIDGPAPIEALARMYLERDPCPAKHEPGYDMGADLLGQAQRANADGVVFLFTKFCDPWGFDYPHLREALDKAQIPSLLVEIEQHVPPAGHFGTRVGAFAEMIASAKQAQKGSAQS